MSTPSFEEFVRDFGAPTTDAEGDLLVFADVQHQDLHKVWSIIEGDDGEHLYVVAGFRVVNKIGYTLTAKPWVTGEEEYLWD